MVFCSFMKLALPDAPNSHAGQRFQKHTVPMPPLCHDRLNRIMRLLARHPHGLSVRELARTYSVWKWEVEQAAALGSLTIETRKPRTGRPARIAIVSNPQPRNLPPMPWTAPKSISPRHWWFALRSIGTESDRKAMFGFRFTTAVKAYRTGYASARSHAGARASASRLKRHPDVKAARIWFYASRCEELPRGEPMPTTADGIYQRLLELGNWRVNVLYPRESSGPLDHSRSLLAQCI